MSVSPLMCVRDSALNSAGLQQSTPLALPSARLLTTLLSSSSVIKGMCWLLNFGRSSASTAHKPPQ
eukprot:7686111-Heterocapsa_arctica.AAC.1